MCEAGRDQGDTIASMTTPGRYFTLSLSIFSCARFLATVLLNGLPHVATCDHDHPSAPRSSQSRARAWNHSTATTRPICSLGTGVKPVKSDDAILGNFPGESSQPRAGHQAEMFCMVCICRRHRTRMQQCLMCLADIRDAS